MGSHKGHQNARRKITYKINENGCWICTSHKPSKYGYPACKRKSKWITISRVMFEERFGEIPAGMSICHMCDNPACINPEHLFLGSHKENMKDMVDKNRQANGNKISRRLTEDDVYKIKFLHNKLTWSELSKLYNVHISTIAQIKTNKTWKHVKEV